PFGLRQMVRNGMNTVLMRDLTDTMYNPARWPYVSHFTGTDLIVSHIEKYVCPTITSDQILGGQPLRFSKDARPHLVMLIAEDEYRTEETLPPFAVDELGRDFRVTMVFGSDQERHRLPGIQAVRDADILLVSMRRRVLPPADLQWVRDFVAAGKPVVGIRTASHAFSLRNQQPPEGLADWPEFDADVFGGNYHGHHANGLSSQVSLLPDTGVPDLNAIPQKVFAQGGSLYQTSPLKEGTTVLATGEIEGQPVEPVAWTFLRKDGGRSFYTSLGHVGDFAHPSFRQLLYQGICWAANIPPSSKPDTAGQHWLTTTVPESQIPAESAASPSTPTWYRCAVRLPQDWLQEGSKVRLFVESNAPLDVWVNGARCSPEAVSSNGGVLFELPSNALQAGEANLIVCRAEQSSAKDFFRKAPLLQVVDTKDVTVHRMLLEGRWQYRHGGDESLAGMPLPAKFGASADVVFRSPEPLWTVRPASVAGLFTAGIEGPACDAAGNVYAVNFLKQGTIGRVSPQGSSEIFVTLPEGSTGNGIRFDSQGSFLVADYTGHNVLRVDPATGKISVLAHNDQMSQPNDLAISPDGTIFASDPDWKNGSGRIWRIDADGSTHCLIDDMGTTNGIEVSPDGQQLYVNESVQRNVWAFDITADKELQNKRLIREFPDFGFDGMRCDVDGNLYITRHGKGTVIKMTPAGDILREIPLPGTKPSNLCFGGPDGCTVYVTEVDGRQLLSFRVDRPGRSFGRQ
ncbi:MAG: SMP-30/gluconolactonase/LRE family protein, partial [Planctomycetaceae bacterium]|nr:SMP-30/gluconolactonase/LRE family protein [Planctomycetaceae bacterium]